MIYSIKRFSAIQEKLFADSSKSPQFLIRDVYMEGIKLVEMWSSFTDARGRVGPRSGEAKYADQIGRRHSSSSLFLIYVW